MGRLRKDQNGNIMQLFAPDPILSLVPVSVAAGKVLSFDSAGVKTMVC